jgi:hypothetical protein
MKNASTKKGRKSTDATKIAEPISVDRRST